MQLLERGNQILSRLHLHRKSQEPQPPVIEATETNPRLNITPQENIEIEYEYPQHFVIESPFGEDARQGEMLSSLAFMFKVMSWRGQAFWSRSSEKYYTEDKLPELLKTVVIGPNSETFSHAFTTIKNNVDKTWENDPRVSDETRKWHPRGRDGFKAITIFMPEEARKDAPSSLSKLINFAQIPPMPNGDKYMDIDISGSIPIEMFHSATGRAEITIGALSGRDDSLFSKQIALEMNLQRGTSGIDLEFFQSAFSPSEELGAYLQELHGETSRADLFRDLSEFLTRSLADPKIGRVPWTFDSNVFRTHKKTQETPLVSPHS
jgi:hypothetical protein